MDDRSAQFVILLGNACRDAQIGRIPVEVVTDDGGRLQGVPGPHEADGDEVDGTELADVLVVGDTTIPLTTVAELRVLRPAPEGGSR